MFFNQKISLHQEETMMLYHWLGSCLDQLCGCKDNVPRLFHTQTFTNSRNKLDLTLLNPQVGKSGRIRGAVWCSSHTRQPLAGMQRPSAASSVKLYSDGGRMPFALCFSHTSSFEIIKAFYFINYNGFPYLKC